MSLIKKAIINKQKNIKLIKIECYEYCGDVGCFIDGYGIICDSCLEIETNKKLRKLSKRGNK